MKRIFMLSSQLMFSRGMENLLGGQANVEIIGHESDVTLALKRIRELQPDAVIIDSKDLISASSRVVASILKEAPGAKVISLNLTNDQIRVYHGEQRTARCVDDLLEVIEQDGSTISPITTEEWSALADRRAQVYDFLAAIYNHPIDDLFLQNLAANPLKFISSLEQENDLTGDLHNGLQALQQFQQAMSNRSHESVNREIAVEYHRLLRDSGEFNEIVATHESTYATPESADLIRVAVDKAYTAGAFEITTEVLARPDFIGYELQFMQHLGKLEGLAWANADQETALKYQALERAFIREHLLRWVPHFCDNVITQTKLDFYRGIAGLTKGFILNEGYRVAELMEWISPADDGPAQTDRVVQPAS
jgi:putative dimethyl sulfoxide reductase chaperone